MTRLAAHGLVLVISLSVAVGASRANTLLTNVPGYAGYYYGGGSWGLFSAALASQFTSVVTAADLTNPASFAGVDAVMYVPRNPGVAPLPAELANLATFIATGKRTLLIGENDSWTSWNSAILGLVGGSYFGGEATGTAVATLVHPLTDGVPEIFLPLGGVAPGGTQLFSLGFAALWQPGLSVLTMLDINVVDAVHDPHRWKSNVAAWLAEPAGAGVVPEPGTLALLAFGGAAVLRRRRK